MAPDVRLRLGRLLKFDSERVAALFGGEPVTLKRDVDRATAAQYQAAFRKVGARLRVQPVGQPSEVQPVGQPSEIGQPSSQAPCIGQPSADRPPAAGSASGLGQPQPGDSGPRRQTLAERLAETETVSPPAEQEVQGRVGTAAGQVTVDVPDLAIAPPGAAILSPGERPEAPVAEIDTSGIRVAPVGEMLTAPSQLHVLEIDTSRLALMEPGANLMDAATDVAALEIDVSGLSLADPGVELVAPAPTVERNVDTSALSVAEPGATIGPGHSPGPPPPDTSHICLD